MKTSRHFISLAMERSTLRRSSVTAFIVGTILNGINADLSDPNIGKILLTYCVPFLVSVYSATATRMQLNPGARAPYDVSLSCTSCLHTEIDQQQNDIIPECPQCKGHTHWKKSS